MHVLLPRHKSYHLLLNLQLTQGALRYYYPEQTYQVLAGHLTNPNHPHCVRRHRLVVESRVHEGAGAGRGSLVVFGRHRIVGLQEGL